MRHVLLVEDDRALGDCLRRYLQAEGYQVSLAPDAATARSLGSRYQYEAVILDLMLPDGEGLDLCRELQVDGRPPVLAISARGNGADRMLALEAGADMYLPKPFDLAEMAARVAACIRLGPPGTETTAVTCGNLSIEQAARVVTVAGQPVQLTPKEFDLLVLLVGARDRLLPSRDLLWQVWGYAEGIRTRTLDVHIGRLRRKLAAAGVQGCRIVTKPGVGYGVECDERQASGDSSERGAMTGPDTGSDCRARASSAQCPPAAIQTLYVSPCAGTTTRSPSVGYSSSCKACRDASSPCTRKSLSAPAPTCSAQRTRPA